MGGAISMSGNRTFAQLMPDATLVAERSIAKLDVIRIRELID